MEVFGRRSNAGIWKEETRKSFRPVRGALEADIVDIKRKNRRNENICQLLMISWHYGTYEVMK